LANMAATFEEGEKILAFHGPQIYEGKVIKAEEKPDFNGKMSPRYLTHYNGWNKSWDEWLAPDRMMKYTPENLERQATLIAKAKKDKKKNPRVADSQKGANKGDNESSSKRRRGAAAAEVPEPAETVQVPMPDKLKLKLIDDWNFITRHSKIVKLPREESIAQLLDRYCENIKGSGVTAESLALEVTSGLSHTLKARVDLCCFTRKRGINIMKLLKRNQTRTSRAFTAQNISFGF